MAKKQKGFKGERAFIAKPAEIAFRDFTVGKPHYLVITLTNVSNASISFNVLPLPEKIRVSIQTLRTTSRLTMYPKARSPLESPMISNSSFSRKSTRISSQSSPFKLKPVTSPSQYSALLAKPSCVVKIRL